MTTNNNLPRPVSRDELESMTGPELWARFSSVVGTYTGEHYGAPTSSTSDRVNLARTVFFNHPGETTLLQLQNAGKFQYQARRAEVNHDLRPFDLEVRCTRREVVSGRLHTYYRLVHSSIPARPRSKSSTADLCPHCHQPMPAEAAPAPPPARSEPTMPRPSGFGLFGDISTSKAWKDPESQAKLR